MFKGEIKSTGNLDVKLEGILAKDQRLGKVQALYCVSIEFPILFPLRSDIFKLF